MSKGFIIKELRLTGIGVENASVTFKRGLNVISGLSNTGKSYIFQCIDYMLGASTKPKPITEAAKYTNMMLEIETNNNTTYTIFKKIRSTKFLLFPCKIDEISIAHVGIELKGKLDINDENNISTFLLNLIGSKKLLLRKNQQGKKQNISFRDYVHILMINETKIFSEDSPLLSGSYTSKTAEQSAFKAILTGLDDSECDTIEDPKLKKSKIEGKIELIESFIADLIDETKSLRDFLSKIELQSNVIEQRVNELTDMISKSSNIIHDKMKEKTAIWDKVQAVNNRIQLLNELLARFNLLEKHYNTDLERLEFISEGQHYISQLIDMTCPLCNNPIQNYDDTVNSEEELNVIRQACGAERNKIIVQLNDLRSTVNAMQSELSDISAIAVKRQEEFKAIDKNLTEVLKPVVAVAQKELNDLVNIRNKVKELEKNEIKLKSLYLNKYELETALKKSNPKLNYDGEVSEVTLDDFAEVIKDMLKSWNYEETDSVIFDPNEYDIIVSGKQRKSHGKGYRAILSAAILVSLMKYVKREELPHPGIVVLDSPLLALKEQQNIDSESDEVIPETMQESFFEYLADNIKEEQIIILENKEPSDKIKDKIHYIEFTRSKTKGRYGFIPVR